MDTKIDDDTTVHPLTERDWLEVYEKFGLQRTRARMLFILARATRSTIEDVRGFSKTKFEKVVAAMTKQGSFD